MLSVLSTRYLNNFRLKFKTRRIIVLGNQKSGTSVIAHLLADYCGLSKTVDIPALWYPTIQHVLRGNKSLRAIVRRNPEYFLTDLIKEPLLTFCYNELKSLFPCSAWVFVIRDPRDNIRSILDRIGVPGELGKLHNEKWKIPDSWQHIFDSRLWSSNKQHYIEILADRWNRTADTFLENSREMELVLYEHFKRSKEKSIATIAQNLDLPQKGDISDKVNVQYQPKGNQDISWKAFFGDENLNRINRICGERMKEFGYDPRLLD